MSEIISSPLIFSEQEVKDRYNLHQFIHKLFIPCKTGTGDLIGLPAEDLYHIYKIQYPMNSLTSAIVSNMLLTGGFVNEENPEMSTFYGRINESYFLGLKKEAKVHLLPFIKDPLALRFRQILIGIKIVNKNDNSVEVNPEYMIKPFLQLFTLNKDNAYNYLQYFTPEYRSSAVDVYNYYRLLCVIYKWPCMDKATFSNAMVNMGYESTKGRVYGKAGMRYFPHLYIPRSVDDRVLSVELNMCCIFNGNTHWCIEGVLENLLEAQRADICDKNLERMGLNEQERKALEKQKAEFDVRGTFETGEVPLSQAAKTYEEQNNLGYYERLGENSEEIKIETSQVTDEDAISRTSGFKGTEDRNAANDYPNKNVAAAFDEPLDIGESYKDRYAKMCADIGPEHDDEIKSGADNEGIGDDTVEGDGPSIEEIASALTVPYAMSVATGFTKEVMFDWLQKMNIPDPEKVLESYDDIMEILHN